MDSISLSQSVSKEFGNEKTSMSELYFGDLEKRIDAITTEVIEKGNTVLDTYKVLSDAISGGMGSVWRVHHQSWNTDLAMKRPQPRFFAEGGDAKKKQFIEECENWINLGLHPNIVSCYYVREIGGVPTIFSEWMDNGSLKDRIADGSLYEGTEAEVQERILDIAIQAARGLQYSHENGLIHQDMKPGNLLLSKDWDAKVADFGLAKAKSDLEKSETAKTTGYTLAYCPTEQANGGKPEKWMDVYAWALTVLEMYAGKRLWDTGAEAKKRFDNYISKCEHIIPDKLKLLLKTCLTEKPDGFEALVKRLSEIYKNVSGSVFPRPGFTSSAVSADNRNNYALSMLDLGLQDIALETWSNTISENPDHVQSVINRAFFLWRNAQMTDLDVMQIINSYPDFDEKADASDHLALERGVKLSTDSGVADAEIQLGTYGVDPLNAVYESNDTLWITANSKLFAYDTLSGKEKLCLTEDDLGSFVSFLAMTKDKKELITGRNPIVRYNIADRSVRNIILEEPSKAEKISKYPQDISMRNGKKYVLTDRQVSGEDIWLEEDDSVLCILEKSEWADAEEYKKYSRWRSINSITGGSKPEFMAPKFTSKEVYAVLRFHFEDETHARLFEIKKYDADARKPEGEQRQWSITSYIDHLGNKHDGLTANETGRVARTLESFYPVRAISPDGKQFCYSDQQQGLVKVCLCPTPDLSARKPWYMMSRIKDIGTIVEEDERSKVLYQAFERAIEGGNYAQALRCFEEYREMPDHQDWARTVQMEKQINRVCERRRLHHYHFVDSSEDSSGFELSAREPEWISYGQGAYLHEGSRFSSDELDSFAHKAEEIVKSKLPIKFRTDSGEKRKLVKEGLRGVKCTMIKKDYSEAYVCVYHTKNDDRDVVVWVDLTGGAVKAVAMGSGSLYIAPDGRTMALVARRTRILRDSLSGYEIQAPDDIEYAKFSPDSNFLLLSRLHTGGYTLLSVRPEDCKQEPYEVQQIQLPNRPSPRFEPGRRYMPAYVQFSPDGFHLMMVNKPWGHKGDDQILPWMRLSYDYFAPGTEKDNRAKNQGIFSKLFKTK